MKNKKNNVTIWIICGVILVVLIAVIVVLIINGTSSQKVNNTIEENTVVEKPIVKITEQDIIDAYGVSKKDAEELALASFNSDNYECEVEITDNYTYIVTVKDIIDESKYVFEVDPQTKTAFLKEE